MFAQLCFPPDTRGVSGHGSMSRRMMDRFHAVWVGPINVTFDLVNAEHTYLRSLAGPSCRSPFGMSWAERRCWHRQSRFAAWKRKWKGIFKIGLIWIWSHHTRARERERWLLALFFVWANKWLPFYASFVPQRGREKPQTRESFVAFRVGPIWNGEEREGGLEKTTDSLAKLLWSAL